MNNSLIPYTGKSKKSLFSLILDRAKDKGYRAIVGLFALLLVASGFFTRKEVEVVEVCVTDTIYQKVPQKPKKAKLITGKVVSEVPPTVPSTGAEKYIAKYVAQARISYQKDKVLPSITLAQGLIESNAGTSKLAKSNNNHFGMKCFSRHCKKGHCSNFTDDTHKDFFLKFSNSAESYMAHGKFLKNSSRYRKLFTYGKDYRKWAHGLQSAGYATDKTYAQKLIGVIERYKLYQYD